MKDRSKVHRDGKGATFVGRGGYTGYRLLRIKTGRINIESKWAVVKERHQRHGTLEVIIMPIRKWERLLEAAREGKQPKEGGLA